MAIGNPATTTRENKSVATLTYQDLVQKMLNDDSFRTQMVKAGTNVSQVQDVLKAHGIEATDQMAEALSKVDYQPIADVMQSFNGKANSSMLVC